MGEKKGSSSAEGRSNHPFKLSEIAAGILALFVLAFDLSLPLGVAAPMAYVAVVLLALQGGRVPVVWTSAAVSTLLTTVGFFGSAHRTDLWIALLNRALSVGTIWAVAIVGLRAIRSAFAEQMGKEHAHHLFAEVVEASPVGLLAADRQGFIVLANRAAERIFGYGPDQLSDKLMKEFVPTHITDPREATQPLGTDLQLKGQRKNGETFPLEVRARLLVGETNVKTLVAVTDQTKATLQREEIERHAAALERSNQDLERFAYVASHDLQEPLRMVRSYTELLRKRYEGKLDEKADRYIDHASGGAERMQKLLDGLLGYSRVAKGDVEFENVELDSVLQGVLTDLDIRLKETGAEVDSDKLPAVRANAVLIHQLLQNLIANGLKFQPKGGQPKLRISADRDGLRWKIGVHDNGIGVDPMYQDQIFEIFKRLHGRPAYPGNGVGLAISKRIVERHRGKIWIESVPDQGASFFFTLASAEATADLS